MGVYQKFRLSGAFKGGHSRVSSIDRLTKCSSIVTLAYMIIISEFKWAI
jgi:hypothetical protein